MATPKLLTYTTSEILDLFKNAFYAQHGTPMLIGSDDFAASAAFSYVLGVLTNAINVSSNERFIESATGQFLDAIAAVNGLSRPNPAQASALFRLTMANTGTLNAGDLVVTNGSVNFTNLEPIYITDDCDVLLYCTDTGAKYNGIAIGAINTVSAGIGYVDEAQNITISGGGTDGYPYTAEGDNEFRVYILARRADFVVGGSAPAYKSRAYTIDARLLDVCILQDGDYGYQKGKVQIYNLWDSTTINTAVADILNAKVLAACTQDDFRPIGDLVEVYSARKVAKSLGSSWLLKYRLRDRDVAYNHMISVFRGYRDYLISGFRRAFSEGELTRRFVTPSAEGVAALGFDLTNGHARYDMPDANAVWALNWPSYANIDAYVSAGLVQFIDTEA